ncbi:MAG: acetate/propionate family kinase [Ignavibacteriales bacterium]
MLILVTNVGSTSLKFKLFRMEDEGVLASGKIDRIGGSASVFSYSAGGTGFSREVVAGDYSAAIRMMVDALTSAETGVIASLNEVQAVGFKTVHAKNVTGSVLLDERVIQAMEDYNDIAPAHNPPYVTAIRMFQEAMPGKPLVGVFETSFHQTMPDYAYMYSTPYSWYERYGVRRFGFHGASHRYVTERVVTLTGVADTRLVSCHLGGSSSLCAVLNGKSVDTSLGFSVQAGTLQGTRCGDVDWFAAYHVIRQAGISVDEAARQLVKESGLKGVSGVSSEMRDIEKAAAQGNDRARLAVDMFCYTVKKYIGSYAAALGGLDAVAFAGGIGENSAVIRARVLAGLEFMGIEMDGARNQDGPAERVISADSSKVRVYVIPTNEEIIVARETARVIGERAVPGL